MLRRLGVQASEVRLPGDLAALDGLILPGGESTVMDKLTRAFGLAEPLARRIRDGLPVYGSCAGMILLADGILDGEPGQRTLGGLDVVVRRKELRRGETLEVRVHPDDLGRVIGRSGRTAGALRTVVGALAGGKQVRVDIVDTDQAR